MKKTGIILCVLGVLLCLTGISATVAGVILIGQNNNARQVLEVAESHEDLKGNSGADKKEDKEDSNTPDQESVSDGDTQKDDHDALESESKPAKDNEKNNESKESEKKEEESSTPDAPADYELAAPSVCGQLAVKGTQLVDEKGNPVQLRGISTHGLSWFPTFVNQDAFRQFRQEWNVNVMRLAMYTDENGGYCTDGNKEDLKNIIYRGVQYATEQDMYVIIDWHVLHDQNPNKYKEEAKDFFDGMSAKYKDNNNVIYEICNEPNGGVSWSEIKSYAEEVIPVIRKNAPNAVILVGTPNWSQRVDEAAKDPITGYENIMYTLHFYAATHKDDLRDTMTKAIADGLPIFVSEYGICDASGNGGLDKDSAQKWVDVMNANNVSYVCWALANKNESAALIKSTCSKNCQFTQDDLSPSGKWLYETLTGNTAGNTQGNNGGDNTETNAGNGNNTQTDSQNAQTFLSSGLEGSVVCKSSWEADGKMNYQFDMILTNPGDSAVSSWAIDIHFSDTITLSDGWGGTYTVNGNTLHVISNQYNGKIEAGATLGDLGFIITGPSGLTVTD